MVGNSVQYFAGKGEVKMFDRTMYVIGANDDRAEAKIRGSEFAGALIDELTLLPENFVKMLLSRLSIPNASLFASTNPDSPFHWVKRDIIDRQEELNCKVFSYTIDDNPSLSEEFKNELKKEYQGLWYKRYIEGKWVMAEGAVYDFFDEEIHVIDEKPGIADYYIVGIDYGTTNPCVFTMIGHSGATYPNTWLEKEYYYDSKKEQRQKSDYDYIQDLIKFMDGFNVKYIYVDPSAASFKQEMRRNEIYNVRDAKNDVTSGIRFQGQLLTNGTYKICKCCVESIREYTNYVWDSKASDRGIDQPVKKNDHCFIGSTKVLTVDGYKQISEIQQGELVITPYGIDKVVGTWESIDKKELVKVKVGDIEIYCTPNHKFITSQGKKQACELTHKDILCRVYANSGEICQKSKSGMEKSTEDIQKIKIEALGYILNAQQDICTGTYGSFTTEKSHKELISITKMETQQITIFTISNVLTEKNTFPSMEKIFQKSARNLENYMSIKSGLLQRNGMQARKAELGIVNMQESNGRKKFHALKYATAVKRNILQFTTSQNSALMPVNQKTEEIVGLISRKELAKFAIKNTNVVAIKSHSLAHDLVVQNLNGRKEKVFNLTTEHYNCYVVEGLAVSNCADAQRYALYTHFFESSGKSMSENEAIMMERVYGYRRS
jgi:PBSX family phage terminase large subunit